jgi:hypothetical protein
VRRELKPSSPLRIKTYMFKHGNINKITRRSFFKISLAFAGLILNVPLRYLGAGVLEAGVKNFFPTRKNPLIIDEKNRSVSLYTEINPENLYKSNPHCGVVFKDGKLADKGILKAYAHHIDFYNALIQIGAKQGNNLSKDNTGEYVKGDELIVTATWQGLNKELSLNDIFFDSTGKGFKIRFGGNKIAAAEENTGCITCLESCWVGITSNAVYPNISSFKRMFSPNSHFRGNTDVLPHEDYSPVVLIYRLKKK